MIPRSISLLGVVSGFFEASEPSTAFFVSFFVALPVFWAAFFAEVPASLASCFAGVSCCNGRDAGTGLGAIPSNNHNPHEAESKHVFIERSLGQFLNYYRIFF